MIVAAVRGVHELERAFAEIDMRTNRATMWAVREAGRKAKSAARKAAPVLKTGSAGTISRRQVRTGRGVVSQSRPVAGLLRASISSGKRLYREGADTFAVHVAPRGLRVHLYSGKAEVRHGFMRAGYAAAASEFPAIAARAWLRSTRR